MQNPNQMISKTMIFDEVALSLRNMGKSEEEIREKVEETLKVCGLFPFRNWPVSALSFGQKKRVTIASVLVQDPELIILDEPTAGQDFRHYTEIMEFLRGLNEKGVTVVMITHDMHLMLEYTPRALVFADGRLIADRSAAAVLCDPQLIRQAALKETSLLPWRTSWESVRLKSLCSVLLRRTGRCEAMAAKTVLNYLPRESVIHKLTGTTKLAFFLLFTFASMITYNTWVLLGLFAVSLAAFKLSKIKFREVRFMMIFMLVFLVLNNLFIFLFDPNQGTTLYGTRHVLCHLFWRYDLTAEQLFYMVNISLKYFVALPVAILFISATNPSEFAASLNSIGISYKVGYSVAIALRYIPDIQRDYHSISQAQQARGVELGKNEHFFARLKNSVNILLPLILTSLNRIDTISNAMELRGFGKDKKRTWVYEETF